MTLHPNTIAMIHSKLSAAEFTLLENAGWTHDDLALAMPQELADAVRKERLIAAAPELLDALQELSDYIDSFKWGQIWPGRPHVLADKARAAIQKATGNGQT